MSTLKVNTIQNTSAAHGSTPEQIAQGRAKAWASWQSRDAFNVYDSFNISSITDNGVGDFTVNFDNNLSNANYAVVGSCDAKGSANGSAQTFSIHSSSNGNQTAPSTSSFRCALILQVNGVNQDVLRAAVVVFGDQA